MKKLLNNLLLASTLLWAASSCSQAPSSDKDNTTAVENAAVTDTASGQKTGRVKAVVTNVGGAPLDSVRVLAQGLELLTNSQGEFLIDNCPASNGRIVLRLQKDGYFDRIFAKEVIDTSVAIISMVKKEESDICRLTTFPAKEGTCVKVQEAEVLIPANAMVKMSDGTDYNGNVNLSVIYYNPDDANFNNILPGGDLIAVDANSIRGKLVSYGMLDVQMKTDSGELLQLKKGSKSKLTFPKPQCQTQKPDSIPLWWFNEKTGLWEEEGISVLNGNNYVGYVSHFTTWNCDVFYGGSYFLEIQFVDKNKKKIEAAIPFVISNDSLNIERSVCSNMMGLARLSVGLNTGLSIKVGVNHHPLPELNSYSYFGDSISNPNCFFIPYDGKVTNLDVKVVDEKGKPINAFVYESSLKRYQMPRTDINGIAKFTFLEDENVNVKELDFKIWDMLIVKTIRKKGLVTLVCRERPHYGWTNAYSYGQSGNMLATDRRTVTKVDLGYDQYVYKQHYTDKNSLYITATFGVKEGSKNFESGIFNKIKKIKRVSSDSFAITYKGSKHPGTYYWVVKNAHFGKMDKLLKKETQELEGYVFNIDVEDTTKAVVVEFVTDTAVKYRRRIGIYKHYAYELEYEDAFGKKQTADAKNFHITNTALNANKPAKLHLYYRDKELKVDSLYICDVYKLEGPLLVANSNEIPADNLKLIQTAMEAKKNNQIYVQFISKDLSDWTKKNRQRKYSGGGKERAEFALYGEPQNRSIEIKTPWRFK